jgi:imidazolonepropionase-like amidohydrolase
VSARNRIVKAMADSGVKLMAGSDAPDWFLNYGWTLHRELQNLVDAGLTPYQALLAATRYPAEFAALIGAGASDFGTIESGKRADLLLLDANPLTDIHNTTKIRGVMASGQWLPRERIDALLEGISKRISP